MKKNFLIEASGSLTSAYLIKSIIKNGDIVTATDIYETCHSSYLANYYIKTKRVDDPSYWSYTNKIISQKSIDFVIPLLDETLSIWANKRKIYRDLGCIVCISSLNTVELFNDKWLAYEFFKNYKIPTPNSSLSQDFELIKPRFGRGSTGVKITNKPVKMNNLLSQEFIEGVEYTVDILCDNDGKPIYIIPRKRLFIHEGKSTAGIVEENQCITKIARKICSIVKFKGPINIQIILDKNGNPHVIEINTRFSAGVALSFEASENWIPLIIDIFKNKVSPKAKEVKYGKEMYRYYAEHFI